MNKVAQNGSSGKAKEINLKEYYDVIKRRFWILILITTLATLAGYFHSVYFKAPPLYQTSTRFILEATSDGMNTLLVLVEDPLVLDQVSAELQLNRSASGLANQISVGSINDSQVVNLTVTDANPETAMAIAEKTVEIFSKEVADLLGFTKIRVIPEANEGANFVVIDQSNDRTLLAFGAGIIISIGLIFLLDTLDHSVRTERDIEEFLGIPLVGAISKMNKKNIEPKKQGKLEQEIRGETISGKQNLDY